jgi:hypothetical protein
MSSDRLPTSAASSPPMPPAASAGSSPRPSPAPPPASPAMRPVGWAAMSADGTARAAAAERLASAQARAAALPSSCSMPWSARASAAPASSSRSADGRRACRSRTAWRHLAAATAASGVSPWPSGPHTGSDPSAAVAAASMKWVTQYRLPLPHDASARSAAAVCFSRPLAAPCCAACGGRGLRAGRGPGELGWRTERGHARGSLWKPWTAPLPTAHTCCLAARRSALAASSRRRSSSVNAASAHVAPCRSTAALGLPGDGGCAPGCCAAGSGSGPADVPACCSWPQAGAPPAGAAASAAPMPPPSRCRASCGCRCTPQRPRSTTNIALPRSPCRQTTAPGGADTAAHERARCCRTVPGRQESACGCAWGRNSIGAAAVKGGQHGAGRGPAGDLHPPQKPRACARTPRRRVSGPP